MFGVHLGFLSTPTTDLAPPFVQIIYVPLPLILCNSVQGKWAVKCWDNCGRYQQVWDGAFFWQDHIHRDVWGIIQFVLLQCFFIRQGKWMHDMVSCLLLYSTWKTTSHFLKRYPCGWKRTAYYLFTTSATRHFHIILRCTFDPAFFWSFGISFVWNGLPFIWIVLPQVIWLNFLYGFVFVWCT